MLEREGSYYRESGAVPVVSVVKLLIYGLLAAAILATIYAYLIHWNPFIYINFLGTLFFGAVVGAIAGTGGKSGKLRNTAVRGVLGFVVGLFALYFAWFVWLGATGVGWDPNPSVMWTKIKTINMIGAWSIRDLVAKGGFLWSVWGAEALLILGITAFVTCLTGKEVFCEKCQQWVEETDTFGPFSALDDPKAFKQALERGDFAQVEALAGVADPGNLQDETLVSLRCCPGCQDLAVMDVETITVTEKKGKTETDSDDLIERMLIAPERFRTLSAKWENLHRSSDDDDDDEESEEAED